MSKLGRNLRHAGGDRTCSANIEKYATTRIIRWITSIEICQVFGKRSKVIPKKIFAQLEVSHLSGIAICLEIIPVLGALVATVPRGEALLLLTTVLALASHKDGINFNIHNSRGSICSRRDGRAF